MCAGYQDSKRRPTHPQVRMQETFSIPREGTPRSRVGVNLVKIAERRKLPGMAKQEQNEVLLKCGRNYKQLKAESSRVWGGRPCDRFKCLVSVRPCGKHVLYF